MPSAISTVIYAIQQYQYVITIYERP